MSLLPEVLLRDMELDGGARLMKVSEQRRRRLSHLEVDVPVLDLHHDIIGELAV